MDLTIGSTKVIDYSFKAGYNSAGEPNSLDVSLTVGSFSFVTKLSNDTKTATMEHSLKNNNTVLLAVGSTIKGDLNSSNAKEATDPSKVITESSAYFQLMNIKIAGTINVKDLYAEGFNTTTDSNKKVELLNKHYKLMAYYADSKKKIADTEFYSYTRTVNYQECNVDANGYFTCVDKTKQVTTEDIRLVFADKSKSDLNNYFANGFNNLSSEFETFIDSFN
jgi:hypothetical protein